MTSILISFFTSFIATYLIIKYQHLHTQFSADSDLSGPQKFHLDIVPRIGGIPIAIGIFMAFLFKLKSLPTPNLELMILISSIPTFTIGLAEDLTKKIGVRIRLIFTIFSAALFVYLLQIQVTRLDIPYLDFFFMIPLAGFVFTVFAITGLANAYNIIDGFNGLSSMVGIITLLAIAYLGLKFSDPIIVFLSLTMASAILGFFIWNYPAGLIFLGDGGAYLTGYWIAALSVLLIFRHSEISPWFALLVNAYPIIETLFTIFRRKIHQGKNPGLPDGIHFHTLIYRRILLKRHQKHSWITTNSKTAPYLWVLTGLTVIPAILWWDSTLILFFTSLLFLTFYIYIYTKIVRFRTPKWLHID